MHGHLAWLLCPLSPSLALHNSWAWYGLCVQLPDTTASLHQPGAAGGLASRLCSLMHWSAG